MWQVKVPHAHGLQSPLTLAALQGVRRVRAVGCVPALLPESPHGPVRCFWWLCSLSHRCQPVCAGFRAAQELLSPCCSGFSFPCSAARAEHTLQAAACPAAWQRLVSPLQRHQGCSSAAAPRTARVTIPGEQLSSWQSASPNQTHQTASNKSEMLRVII